MEKKFKSLPHEIVQMIPPMGSCMASDKIMVEGELIGFMYRAEPTLSHDSGWRFLSGTETQVYADDPQNWAFYHVNTVVNYDPAVIPYLDLPIGTELERIQNTSSFRNVSAP